MTTPPEPRSAEDPSVQLRHMNYSYQDPDGIAPEHARTDPLVHDPPGERCLPECYSCMLVRRVRRVGTRERSPCEPR